jgi:hypothetical protein
MAPPLKEALIEESDRLFSELDAIETDMYLPVAILIGANVPEDIA